MSIRHVTSRAVAVGAAAALSLSSLTALPAVAGPVATGWAPASAATSPPAGPSALVDPDGNPVYVDDDLTEGPDATELLSPALVTSSARAAAAAPKAKKNLKTLVIPVYWAGAGKDTSNAKIKKKITASMKQADTYFRTVSRGKIGHKTTALGWQKISRPSTRCGIANQMDHLTRAASAKAKKAGKNPAKYDRVIIYVTSKACGADHWGALGYGSMPGRYIWLEGTLAPNVVIHELGHNLGLDHSNYHRCATKNSARLILGSKSQCRQAEYGDATDAMGNHPNAGWLSAPKLARLGWLSSKQLTKNTSTRKKTYTLRPLASSSAARKAVRVKGSAGRYYWVEYRTRTGLDRGIEAGLEGVQIRLASPSSWYGSSSVLDMLPNPVNDWNDLLDVPLTRGASWTSPEGIRFSVGSTGATAKVTVQRKVAKAAKPSAPTLRATAADRAVTVSWAYPKDKGTPVQSYSLRVRASDGTDRAYTLPRYNGRKPTQRFDGLSPALTYTFTVRATNHKGHSAWSKAVTAKPLNLVPSVRIVSPTAGATITALPQVTVVPTVPKGSVASLYWVTARLVHNDGFDYAYGYVDDTTKLKSGAPLTVPLDDRWLTAGNFTLVVTVSDSYGRQTTAQQPIVVAAR